MRIDGVPLHDARGLWRPQVSPSDLIQIAERRCPRLVSKLRMEDCGLHLQLAALADDVLHSIDAGDVGTALEVFFLLHDALMLGKPAVEIENAIQISFVTSADLSSSPAGREVLATLPEQLRSLLER